MAVERARVGSAGAAADSLCLLNLRKVYGSGPHAKVRCAAVQTSDTRALAGQICPTTFVFVSPVQMMVDQRGSLIPGNKTSLPNVSGELGWKRALQW